MADIDLFHYRTLLGIISNNVNNPTFLRDRYFPRTVSFTSKAVDIDIIDKRQRKMAPFVRPRSPGSLSYLSGYHTDTFEPALINPMIPLSGEDVLVKAPGETIYSPMSPEQRMAMMTRDALSTLDEEITRREEWMAAQALFTGKIPVKGEGIDVEIDYWHDFAENEKPQTTVAVKWDQSGADPLGDLRAVYDHVGNESGLTPVEAILGADAWQALLKVLLTNGAMDVRRIVLGEIQPQELPNGVSYKGTLLEPNLRLYTYNGLYLDDETNKNVPFVPKDKVLIACRDVKTTRAYGMVNILTEDNKSQWVAAPRVPNSWVQRTEPVGRVIQVSSKPLPIINQPQGFHVMTVIGS